MPSPRVHVTRKLPEPVEARLAERFDVVLNSSDAPMSGPALADAMRSADALLTSVNDAIDAGLIGLPDRRVAVIANFGVGVSNIDLDAAHVAGLVVTNTPGVLTDATADLAIALMLAATRRMTEAEAVLRRGEWDGFRPTGFLGSGLQGKLLGIVGMGRIGQATARRAALGFGMRIACYNRSPVGALDFPFEQLPSLDALFGVADVISLHLPGGEANRGLVSAARIASMKPTAYLVNTARGDVLDEMALAAALAGGKIAGAGLDVYAEEPTVPRALLKAPNLTLLPHVGSATLETRTAMGMRAIDNLVAHFAGGPYPSRVV